VTVAARAIVLVLLACLGRVACGAGELRVPVPVQVGATDLDQLAVRMAAANAVVGRLGLGPGPLRALGAAWLASERRALDVVAPGSPGGTVEAVCPDPDAIAARIASLGRQIQEFGAPVLLVEAERPENADDRRAAAQLQQSLAELGLVAVDADATRARRRSLADAAVQGGLDAAAGRAAIDRPDVDFVLRVRRARREDREGSSYGITLSACEITVSPTLLRSGDQSSVPAGPGVGVARSRSPRAAESESERLAIDGAALAVTGAVSAEWIALALDQRPWIVEVQASDGFDPSRIVGGARGGDVVVLEDRPGIGALMRVPAATARGIESGPGVGTVLQRRPGFVLVAGASARGPGGLVAWAAGAALLGVLCATVAIAWRVRRAARQG